MNLKIQTRQMGKAAVMVDGIKEKSSVLHWDNREGSIRPRLHPPKTLVHKKLKKKNASSFERKDSEIDSLLKNNCQKKTWAYSTTKAYRSQYNCGPERGRLYLKLTVELSVIHVAPMYERLKNEGGHRNLHKGSRELGDMYQGQSP